MKNGCNFAVLLCLALVACDEDSNEAGPEASTSALTAVCAEPEATPEDAWRCGEERTVECASPDGTPVESLYVPPPPAESPPPEGEEPPPLCEGVEYQVSDPGPYAAGDHVIRVTRDDAEVCQATLHVVDTQPPTAEVHETELWPPNHKMHHITAADCVTVRDACDGELAAHLTFAAVDETPDVNGAGKKGEVDIEGLGCDGVDLRAERAGGADGRVYTLGWRAEDAAGHVIEGTCRVVVPHDQGGGHAAVAGEDAVRVENEADCSAD